jgi:hypothetical protein
MKMKHCFVFVVVVSICLGVFIARSPTLAAAAMRFPSLVRCKSHSPFVRRDEEGLNNIDGEELDVSSTSNDQTSEGSLASGSQYDEHERYDEKATSDGLEEQKHALENEERTVNHVIIILCSLGGALVLVAIAIAILYWKLRRQQKIITLANQTLDVGKSESRKDRNSNNVNQGNDNSDGRTELAIAGTDDAHEENMTRPANMEDNAEVGICAKALVPLQHVLAEQPNIVPVIMSASMVTSSAPSPSAPSAKELDAHTEIDATVPLQTSAFSQQVYSEPPNSEPPAYTPSAPPLYELHVGALEFYDPTLQEVIMYTEPSTEFSSHSLPPPPREATIAMEYSIIRRISSMPPLETTSAHAWAESMDRTTRDPSPPTTSNTQTALLPDEIQQQHSPWSRPRRQRSSI